VTEITNPNRLPERGDDLLNGVARSGMRRLLLPPTATTPGQRFIVVPDAAMGS
jgi:hypothetical protein